MYPKYLPKEGLARPRTFSIRTALGVSVRMAFTISGNMLRSSSCPLCFPPIENGWHGTPPASRSTGPLIKLKSNPLTSHSCTGHACMDSTFLAWFSLSVLQAERSRSTTAECSKPALATPSARPPAPLKSSTLCIEKPLDLPFEFVDSTELALPYHADLPPGPSQSSYVSQIAPPVLRELWDPKAKSRLRQASKGTSQMAMPETSVHK